MTTSKPEQTIELRPGVFEPMTERNIQANGEQAGFFHSLGRALQGEQVDNPFLKANLPENKDSLNE